MLNFFDISLVWNCICGNSHIALPYGIERVIDPRLVVTPNPAIQFHTLGAQTMPCHTVSFWVLSPHSPTTQRDRWQGKKCILRALLYQPASCPLPKYRESTFSDVPNTDDEFLLWSRFHLSFLKLAVNIWSPVLTLKESGFGPSWFVLMVHRTKLGHSRHYSSVFESFLVEMTTNKYCKSEKSKCNKCWREETRREVRAGRSPNLGATMNFSGQSQSKWWRWLQTRSEQCISRKSKCNTQRRREEITQEV